MNTLIGSTVAAMLLAVSVWIAPLPSAPLKTPLPAPVYRSTSPVEAPSVPVVERKPPTPTTVPTPPIGACGAWAGYALAFGWPGVEAPQLAEIMRRESACTPNAIGDNGNSYGLLQIHCPTWVQPSTYWPNGWAAANGYSITCNDLLHPATNLALGFLIWAGVPGSSGGWWNWTTYTP
jgi:hypothetical protein